MDSAGFFLDIPILQPIAQSSASADDGTTSANNASSQAYELDTSGNIFLTLKSTKDTATQTFGPHFSTASGQSLNLMEFYIR